MQTEDFKKLKEKAKSLKVAITKDGKALTAAELNAAVVAAEKRKAEQLAEKAQQKKEKSLEETIKEVKAAAKDEEKTIQVTGPLAGRFLLSHTIGEVINIEAKQADEIIAYGSGKQL